MAERIYIRAERGRLEPLEEKPFSTEDELQALIAEYPELLDGEQIRPGDPRRWILISREKGIAETSDAATSTIGGGQPSWPGGSGSRSARCISDDGRITVKVQGVMSGATTRPQMGGAHQDGQRGSTRRR